MISYKKDFPIFAHNPGLIFLDSAASSQKPAVVIDGVADFLRTSYANIHRGNYDLSERSEDLYDASKAAYAKLIGARADEIIYTYNATYGFNMLAQTLWYSGILEAGDVVLVDIAEHHANIVPWQMLSQRHGIIVEWIDLMPETFQYDLTDFQHKYTDRVKVVSLSAASNVTGVIYQLDGIISQLREDTFLIIDGSQLVPHAPIQAATATGLDRIDAYIATGHKLMTDTGLGMIRLRKPWIKKLSPARWGGGMIVDVRRDGYAAGDGIGKFEPGTPHIAGAVSLLYACKYIESIGGYDAIMTHEAALVDHALVKCAENEQLTLLGPLAPSSGSVLIDGKLTRLGIFSFTMQNLPNHVQIGEKLALQNIAVRCGGHCTHPLFHSLETQGSCRMSTYIYTDIADIDAACTALNGIS